MARKTIYKFVPIKERTHALLTRLIAKKMLEADGKRVTYDDVISNLIATSKKI